MPCFRGVDVSITAITEARRSYKLPEFLHPDGSSVRLYTSSPQKHGTSVFLSPRRLPTVSEEGRAQKPNPRISVYVPSLPGASFFFEYAITNAPLGYNYLFFKVFMNGRHIVSWGIDLRKAVSGTMYRALYEPSGHYQQRENGVLVSSPGIEARSFKFVSELGPRSVADDGGLIEFQVFRAKGRNGRSARLDQHRNQDKYGIAMLSDGLLDEPEGTTYYDYHLADPKDCPYAAFRFHYRTWENLEQLQLIPPGNSRPSSFSANSAGLTAKAGLDDRVAPEEPEDHEFSFGFAPRGRAAFGVEGQAGGANHGKSECKRRQDDTATTLLQFVPKLKPYVRPAEEMSQPCKVTRDNFSDSYLQRPLPDLPLPEEPGYSHDLDTSRHSRASSTRSLVSVAPSLLSKLSRESFATDKAEYGVATEDEVVHRGRARLCEVATGYAMAALPGEIRPTSQESQGDYSISDYAASLLSTEDSSQPSLLSPGQYLATTGSQLERHLAATQSPARQQALFTPNGRDGSSPNAGGLPRGDVDSDLDLPRIGTLQLTEHQWLTGGRGSDAPETSHELWSPPISTRRRSTRSTCSVENGDARKGNYASYDAQRGGNWI